jgi:hypothetical protein
VPRGTRLDGVALRLILMIMTILGLAALLMVLHPGGRG